MKYIVSNPTTEGKKMAYDPALHSIKSKNRFKAKIRYEKRDKQKKQKRKVMEKELDYIQDNKN